MTLWRLLFTIVLIMATAISGAALGASAAFAEAGGEPNNTHCNGIGNPNSYCDGSEIIDNPPPPETPGTEYVCLVPTDAAATFLSSVFLFAPGAKECSKQCRSITNTCRAVVEGQAKCFDGLIKGVRSFTLAGCNEIEDATAHKECSATIREASKANSATLRINTSEATHTCGDTFDVCVAACGA